MQKLALNAKAQIIDPSSTVAPSSSKAITTTAVRTTTTNAPSSTVAPVPSSTTVSTLAPVPSSSSVVPPSIASSTTTTTTTTTTAASSTVAPSASSLQSTSATPSPTIASSSSTSSSTSTTPSASASPKPKDNPTNNTPLIVGCVVGGVVGIALIGGILACINRRGGCTKRRDNKKSDFEDYGLGDFPHHRATTAVANNTKPVSPTLPRLNDQGNYYANENYGGHYSGAYVDNNMDYGMQQQQSGYYYPQQTQQQEYYDDGNYYYDNTSATAYSSMPPMHSPAMHNNAIPGGQQGYAMGNIPPSQSQHDMYKPDDVGSPNNNIAGNVPHN
ncbi:hypothetical protein [Parasitella parasitica]|uniref:Mid2 domain-containing protein n=1 Tax=Parasitella parasitica TaxID=35722 RepID=A0A0B7NDJ3_9FUNG|nr:hypothetical protein [Parasitella parasitica]